MIHKEVAGFYFTQNGASDVSHIYMGRHINNTATEARIGNGPYNIRPELLGGIQPNTVWHTHPANAPDEYRLRPSGLYDGQGDIKNKNNNLSQGFKHFIILTKGYSPIPF